MNDILLVNAGATLALTGLVWFVQLVHYPLFDRVSADQFPRFVQSHLRLSVLIVGPLMLAEVVTSVILVMDTPGSISRQQVWLGFVLVFLIWLSTALLQIPQHQVLEKRYDVRAHELLVVSNWIRTSAWTARSILVVGMLRGSMTL